jgi:hypothetical protein
VYQTPNRKVQTTNTEITATITKLLIGENMLKYLPESRELGLTLDHQHIQPPLNIPRIVRLASLIAKIKPGIQEYIIGQVRMPLNLLHLRNQIRIDNLLPRRLILIEHILENIADLAVDHASHFELFLFRELDEGDVGVRVVLVEGGEQLEGFVHDAPAEFYLHVLV